MKKRLTVLLTLMVLLLTMVSAQAVSYTSYTAENYFTISYDAEQYTLDNQTYAEECTETYQWLFMLYDESNAIDVSTELVEEYEGLTLSTADEDAQKRYQQDVLDAFSDQNAEFVTRYTGSKKIPFFIFHMQDEDGTYFMAETVINGRIFDFMSYPVSMEAVTDENFEILCNLLETFTPVEEGQQ